MWLKGVKTPMFLFGNRDERAKRACYAQPIHRAKPDHVALNTFILLMRFIDEPAKCVYALSEPSVLDTLDFLDFLFSAKPDLLG